MVKIRMRANTWDGSKETNMTTILQVNYEIIEKYDVGQGFPGGSLGDNPLAKARDAEERV